VPSGCAEQYPAHDGDALRALVQRFVREIGLLSSDRTPCGRPIAVSHAHALMVLLEHRRAGLEPTQRELGQVLGIDKSNVTRLCRKMERAGQLVQQRDAKDGRMRLLALTERGVRLAASVERSSRDRFQRLMGAVRHEHRGAVLSALGVLNEALAASATPAPPDRSGRDSRDAADLEPQPRGRDDADAASTPRRESA